MINLHSIFWGNAKNRMEHGGDRQPGQPPRTSGQNVQKWRGLSEKRETKNTTAQKYCGARLIERITLRVQVICVSCERPQTLGDNKRLFLTVYRSE